MTDAGEADVLDAVQMPGRHQVRVDRSRDALLTEFGRATLSDRYLMPGEDFQDLFARVASYYGDDPAHAQRLYDYISKLWFMPATPVLSNGGTNRGLPISCFLNEASDSLDGIVGLWNENVLAGVEGRRHRLVLGQSALDRREGRRGRQDLGRDPVHPGDGFADAGDFAGLAAARFGGGVPAGVASGDRGVHRDPPPHRRRSESQGAEPASRHPGARRVHARGGGGRAVGADLAEGRVGGAVDLGARRCGFAS